jgi:hypothetical protein
VSGAFEAEVAAFELAGPRWIAAGSSVYSGGSSYSNFTALADTLKWSDDQGTTWNNASGAGVFNVSARFVVYGGNRWLAAGLVENGGSTTVTTALSYSDDGATWSSISLPSPTFNQLAGEPIMPLPEITSIWTDDSNWYVLEYILAGGVRRARVRQHSLTGDLTTGWTLKTPTSIGAFSTSSDKYLHGFASNFIQSEPSQPTTIALAFNALAPFGPVVTSPTSRSFTFYQYVTITPIVFSATGTGTIYYFVDDDTLPRGLRFNVSTGTLSGTPIFTGQSSFAIYLKDDIGVTRVDITVNTVVPRVIRQQTSAGAWTSMVRQYTVVNAAQNSVNGRALPATEPALGEFMRPEPPDSVSASGNPNCEKC